MRLGDNFLKSVVWLVDSQENDGAAIGYWKMNEAYLEDLDPEQFYSLPEEIAIELNARIREWRELYRRSDGSFLDGKYRDRERT